MPSKLKKLLQEVRACQICEQDLPAGPRSVLQVAAGARILIAGQAPGRKVHESGVPFDDASGDRLRSWMGVDAATFYDPSKIAILPMGFCFPGTGSSGDLPPRPECAPAWREGLLGHLTNLDMTLVMGQYSMSYHFPDTKGTLTSIVQDWQSRWPKTVPLPHPSPRNNRWFKRNAWFEENLVPVLREHIGKLLSG